MQRLAGSENSLQGIARLPVKRQKNPEDRGVNKNMYT